MSNYHSNNRDTQDSKHFLIRRLNGQRQQPRCYPNVQITCEMILYSVVHTFVITNTFDYQGTIFFKRWPFLGEHLFDHLLWSFLYQIWQQVLKWETRL